MSLEISGCSIVAIEEKLHLLFNYNMWQWLRMLTCRLYMIDTFWKDRVIFVQQNALTL